VGRRADLRIALGPHRVLIELVDANHQPLDKGVTTFLILDEVAPNCRR